MVRAKFKVTQVGMPYGEVRTVVLTPQYDTSIEEDKRFAKASPSGRLEITIDNPPAAAELAVLGKDFYIDFTEVPKADTP
jgi:hypothetical protein